MDNKDNNNLVENLEEYTKKKEKNLKHETKKESLDYYNSINQEFKTLANNIKTQKEMDELILNICKKNKIILTDESKFIKTFKKIYNNYNLKIKDYHLKYLFSKYKKMCIPNTMDEIFEYSKDVNDLGLFCRDVTIKNI